MGILRVVRHHVVEVERGREGVLDQVGDAVDFYLQKKWLRVTLPHLEGT